MTMAPDDEKTTVQKTEDTPKDKPTKKGLNKLILYGGIGMAVILIGVVLALFVLKPMMSGSDGGEKAAQVGQGKSNADAHQAKPEPKKKPAKSGGRGEAAPAALVYAIKDIVVNPAGTGGTRFLSVSFGFELDSPELTAAFEERELAVRDALITILSSKTVAQLTDAKEKEIARYQIKKRLEQLLSTNEITGVYYTDFVLQ
jgi:flagellar FliL protein